MKFNKAKQDKHKRKHSNICKSVTAKKQLKRENLKKWKNDLGEQKDPASE